MTRPSIANQPLSLDSPFTLTRVAAKRARQLARGADAKLPWNDHKSTVLALQEIAEGYITAAVLDEAELPAAEPYRPEMAAVESDLD